jgi:hypothetical protein
LFRFRKTCSYFHNWENMVDFSRDDLEKWAFMATKLSFSDYASSSKIAVSHY